MDIEKLIHKAITTESINKNEIAEILSESVSGEHDKKYVFMKLYDVLYDNTLCKEECENWVESMSGGDENGQKWTVEEITEIGNRIGIDFDKITKYELWCVTHYEYYTHKDSLKKSGIPTDNVLFVRFGYDFANANEFDMKSFYFNVICEE